MSRDLALEDEYIAEIIDRYEDSPEELAYDLGLSIMDLVDAFREVILERRPL
jgi:hypothetical protein